MIKKILLYNRKIVRGATIYMFFLGGVMTMIIGVCIIIGSPATIPVPKLPYFCGYLFFYGGIVLLLMFMLDKVYKTFGVCKPHKKVDTLRARIAKAEFERK